VDTACSGSVTKPPQSGFVHKSRCTYCS